MHVVVVSNDWVRITYLLCLLRDAGLDPVLLDQHVSLIEGGTGAFPRRIAVDTRDLAQARRILDQAGEM